MPKVSDYRPCSYVTPKIDLTLELDPQTTLVKSKLEVQRTEFCQPNEPLVLDTQDLELVSIQLNGHPLQPGDYKIEQEKLTILKPPGENAFVLEIENKIHPAANKSYEGIYRSGDKEGRNEIFTSHCEAEGFRRITPYIDRPDNLAVFTTTLIGDEAQNPILLTNGNVIKSGKLNDGRHFSTRLDEIPKPSYLFACVAGKMGRITDYYTTKSGRKIELNIFCEDPDEIENAQFGMEVLKKCLAWDENRFGIEYDLDNYNIVGVRLFNMGAMENKGLNIFLLGSILAEEGIMTDQDYEWVMTVIAHEFAHNKAGNIVTVEKWADLSLKEGLASTLEQEFLATQIDPVLAQIKCAKILREHQFVEDASPTAHAVRPEEYSDISNFYTTTIYQKGEAVKEASRTLIGDEKWVKHLQTYFTRYQGQAASLEKFYQIMSEVTGRDLKQFFRWYTQAGTPVLDFEWEQDPAQKTATLTITQKTPPTPGQDIKLPLHIPVSVGLIDKETGKDIPLQLKGEAFSQGTTRVLELTQPRQRFTFVNIQAHGDVLPSLLRNFSAPVKIGESPYQDEENLKFMIRHDSDGFNRWDSAFQMMEINLNKIMTQMQRGQDVTKDEEFINLLEDILLDETLTPGLKAEMLTLPSPRYMLNKMSVADPDLVQRAHDLLSLEIGRSLVDTFEKTYDQIDYYPEYTPKNAELRSLQNVCLQYLMRNHHISYCDKYVGVVFNILEDSDNMTERLSALSAILKNNPPKPRNHRSWYIDQDDKLESFLDEYRDKPNVVSEYLSLQAMRGEKSLDLISMIKNNKKLFSLNDPDQVRSLYRVFARNNITAVHDLSGRGYRLLTDAALEIDATNSETATMLIKPLTEFVTNADPRRLSLLENEFRRLKAHPGLSKAATELVNKALSAIEKKHEAKAGAICIFTEACEQQKVREEQEEREEVMGTMFIKYGNQIGSVRRSARLWEKQDKPLMNDLTTMEDRCTENKRPKVLY